MESESNPMEKLMTTKVESITIVPAKRMSAVARAKENISEEDFVELRIVKNSPRRLEMKKIKKEVRPTEGFRAAISKAGLLGETFD